MLNCVTGYKFFAINSWPSNLNDSGISGFLGLAAGNNGVYFTEDEFLTDLFSKKLISSQIFSICWDMAGT